MAYSDFIITIFIIALVVFGSLAIGLHEQEVKENKGYNDGYNYHNEKLYNYYIHFQQIKGYTANDDNTSAQYIMGYINGYNNYYLDNEKQSINN